jgi:anti-sigma-K factor RskA
MVPAGMMPEGPDHTMLLEGPAADAIAVGITVEPEGGSPAPTTEPIALFDLSEAT